MKFTDGNWLTKEGVDVYGAVEAYDVATDNESITVYAPHNHINHRGATLAGPVLTVNFSSPMEDVIKVKVSHYTGQKKRGPEFELYTDENHKVKITNDEKKAILTSGNLSVQIENEENWSIDFYDKEDRLTGTGYKSMAYVTTKDGTYIREQLDLGVGEYVYGLGERFTPFAKNGQTVEIWNRDGGTGSEQAYKNIPFYLTNKGYGVFVNSPDKVSFEVASEKVSKSQFSVPGEELEYYIINGTDLKEVLERYTTLTGKPALPPAWSFGLWLTTSFTTDYDEDTVTGFVKEMEERDVPLHVFHFDCFWMKEYHWTNFKWDQRVFPEPEAMLTRLKERGLNICVWINPYIAQRSELFKEGKEKGYLIKKLNGDVWQWDLWQPGLAIVDFTNPKACEWFAKHLERLIDMGVDSFKTDFGERIPTDVVYHDGSNPEKMHNYYTYLYNKVVFEVLERRLGKGKAALFARSATVGGQQFPVHWGGDCYASYESMAESLRGGLSLGLSGFGFWSHDIGGFEDTASADLYKRWAAFGLLSSHSRLHGNCSYRVPWMFDEEAVDVLRFFTKLKSSLMPYIFKQAVEAKEKGLPVMRAMLLEFLDDPTATQLDCQYMLGNCLLVAPIFNEKGDVTYYLPEGKWTNFITGEEVKGGRWVKENHDYMSIPLMVRPNSIIAVGNNDQKPDYDYSDNVTLHLFNIEEGAESSTEIYNIEGELELEVSLVRRAKTISIEAEGINKPWSILLRNVEDINQVKGGEYEVVEDGVKVTSNASVTKLEIELI